LTYGDDVRDVIIRTAIDAINVISVQYSYDNFFTDRITIQDAMLTQIDSDVYATTWHHVPHLQMRSVDLPSDLEDEIENT
jgi:hypothetical protein